jgi:uncharacterized protein (DUF934 family)
VPLLNKTGWAADAWVRGDADASAVIVPFEAFEQGESARRPGQRFGVDLPNHVPVARLRPYLSELDLIGIAFPAFGDGRGFSLARALRGEGYRGRLRAVGQLIPDQFPFAIQAGFDEVEIGDDRADRQPLFQWLEALGSISESYQSGGGGPSILAQRREEAA